MSELLEFLREPTRLASILYGFFYIFYLGLIIAMAIACTVVSPRRGWGMVATVVLYTLVSWQGTSLTAAVTRAREASNSSVFRLLLVVIFFSFMFSVIVSPRKRNPS